MNSYMDVNVDVEYCGACGYDNKFDELSQHVKDQPKVTLLGHKGRRASFEVKVNGVLVHSKLSTMAFPDYSDLACIVKEATEGKTIRTCKQQPITSCMLM